jgi:hypothetical protein
MTKMNKFAQSKYDIRIFRYQITRKQWIRLSKKIE